MPTLPEEIIPILLTFTPQFTKPVFRHIQVLVIGFLLTPGARTVCAALRVMGLSGERQFQTDHRVLNRDQWSSGKVAPVLLGLLVRAFVPWVVMSLLCEVPFAGRVWALPFLSVLAPSERYHEARGQRHKTLTEWAGQMIAQVRRWLPDRLLVVVSDRSYAALELRDRCRQLSVTMITD